MCTCSFCVKKFKGGLENKKPTLYDKNEKSSLLYKKEEVYACTISNPK